MSMSKIAKLANVTVSTVSKAFSGSNEVSAETRKLIFDAARELGYFDKYNKQFNKKVIAVIAPEFSSDIYYSMLMSLKSELYKQGGIMTISVTDFSKDTEQELYNYYSSYLKADGIIVIESSGCDYSNVSGLPVVAIHREIKGIHADVVQSNIVPAIHEALSYLRENGHKNIAFIGDKLSMRKCEMIVDEIKKMGFLLKKNYIKISEKRFEEAGIEMMDELFSQNIIPDVVFASYDYIALGVIKSIKKHGLQIPKDISVIGTDDIAISRYSDPSLSSISFNVSKICQVASKLIMKRINSRYPYPEDVITIPSEFIIRDSIGKAKNSEN